MRPVLLCILLVCGLTTPASAQQQKSITNSIGMKLVLIHAGSFTMGSPESEPGRQTNESLHKVTISKSYYLGAYEVTQGEYAKVMGKTPSFFKGNQLPVELVNWDDAVSFCKQLSELPDEKGAGRVYRLPAEAEWEYACRAGGKTAFSLGRLLGPSRLNWPVGAPREFHPQNTVDILGLPRRNEPAGKTTSVSHVEVKAQLINFNVHRDVLTMRPRHFPK